MAESSRRLRKSTSTGIAATSAIALALGGLSVVGPGPLTPHAAAATLSGGIRDKSGAVEKDAQKVSDLPAGSCVVERSGTAEHSQAGFSWKTLEPAADSPDKTLWGLSVSFDNSKDRTFADWSFTNGGELAASWIPARCLPWRQVKPSLARTSRTRPTNPSPLLVLVHNET
nr:adhesin domain containing protein [Corynebacterium sp. NML140438]